jgi:hypothetical protein
MPNRFISRTTSSPNEESPSSFGVSVAESAQGTLRLCVRVMYRAPRRYIMRSVGIEELIACPPSMPMSDAIFRSLCACSMSSCRQRQRQLVGIARHHPVHDVDLFQRRRH